MIGWGVTREVQEIESIGSLRKEKHVEMMSGFRKDIRWIMRTRANQAVAELLKSSKGRRFRLKAVGIKGHRPQ